MEFLKNIAIDSMLFQWLVLPLLICLARITDQTIGTIRLIFVSKGYRNIAPILAFFESLVWLLAISQIMNFVDNWITFIAWAIGYSIGNYVGIVLEERLSIGTMVVRVFPTRDFSEYLQYLDENNHGYTIMNAEGRKGALRIIFSIIDRKHLQNILENLEKTLPGSFYTVEEVRNAQKGIFKPTPKKMISSLRK
ncbi:MAG: DUF5698 domain-containing protein [Bacteroidales bacterium]|jgi:uncharacterized protein YebE (UPF0316 family)|nr:DUF5698 domain-containing protein [Bacteroidales bacterium]